MLLIRDMINNKQVLSKTICCLPILSKANVIADCLFKTIVLVFSCLFFSSIVLASGINIEIEDTLNISVYDHSDLETVVQVSSDGNITFPLIGLINASGLSPRELEKKIEGLLGGDYIINPYVTVFVQKSADKSISVLGEIKRPGPVLLKNKKNMTPFEAIASAGGFTDSANKKAIMVTRTINGVKKIFNIMQYNFTENGMVKEKGVLIAGDIVEVREKFF